MVASIKIRKSTNKKISTNLNWIAATTAATSMTVTTTTEAKKGRAAAFAVIWAASTLDSTVGRRKEQRFYSRLSREILLPTYVKISI